jgi:hypothetical protein
MSQYLITPALLHPRERRRYYCTQKPPKIIWNTFRSCPEAAEITDFNIGVGALKSRIKSAVVRCQKIGDPDEWDTDINFKLQPNSKI